MRQIWAPLVITLLLVAACGKDPEQADEPPASATGSSSVPEDGYVAQVNVLCDDLLAQVLTFDIGNAVTYDQFLEKHEPLVAAIRAFDAEVDTIPVTDADRPAADAFDAYRSFSDAADAEVVAAARTGDQATFEAANIAFLEKIHANPAEITAMHEAGIECKAR